MTADAFLLMRGFIEQIWRLFNSWYIPGTRITPAAMGFFYLAVSLGVWLLKRYFMGGGDDDE